MNVFKFIQSGKESYFCPIEKKVFTKTSIEGMEVVIASPLFGEKSKGYSVAGDIKLYYVSGNSVLSLNSFRASEDLEGAKKTSFLFFSEKDIHMKILDAVDLFIKEKVKRKSFSFLSGEEKEQEDYVYAALENFFEKVFKKEDIFSLEHVWLKNKILGFFSDFSEIKSGEVLDFFYEGERTLFSIIDKRVPDFFYRQAGELFSIYKKLREAFSKNTPIFHIKDPEKMKERILKAFSIEKEISSLKVRVFLEKEEEFLIKNSNFYSFIRDLFFYRKLDINLLNYLSEEEKAKVWHSFFVKKKRGIYHLPLSLIEGFYIEEDKVFDLKDIREIIE